MPRVKGTTSNLQSQFLRAFRRSLTGPAPHEWPTPAILRKWLRKPGFRRALLSIRKTMYFERGLQVLAASLHGARNLHEAVHPGTAEKLPAHTQRASTDLLRLTHQPPSAPANPRVRAKPLAQPDPYANETLEEAAVRLMHPNCRPEVAITFIKDEPHPYYQDPDDPPTDPHNTPEPDPTDRI